MLDAYLREQEQLVYCAMEQFDLDQLQKEIEEKQKVGDLDEVFQKYCRCGKKLDLKIQFWNVHFLIQGPCLSCPDLPSKVSGGVPAVSP